MATNDAQSLIPTGENLVDKGGNQSFVLGKVLLALIAWLHLGFGRAVRSRRVWIWYGLGFGTSVTACFSPCTENHRQRKPTQETGKWSEVEDKELINRLMIVELENFVHHIVPLARWRRRARH